jgi:hypothetical protein
MPIIRRPLGASLAYTNKSKDIAETDSILMDDFSKFPESPPDGQDGLYLYHDIINAGLDGVSSKYFNVRDVKSPAGIIETSTLIFDPSMTARNEIRTSIIDYKSTTAFSPKSNPAIGASKLFEIKKQDSKTKFSLAYPDYGLTYSPNLTLVRDSKSYTIPYINADKIDKNKIFDSGYDSTKDRDKQIILNPPLYSNADNITIQSVSSTAKLKSTSYPQPVVTIGAEYNGKLQTMFWQPSNKTWTTNEYNFIIIGGALTFNATQLEIASAGAVQNKSVSDANGGEGLIDFRQKIRERIKSNDVAMKKANKLMPNTFTNYKKGAIENRVNLGDPGNPDGKDLSSYDGIGGSLATSYNSYDKINAGENGNPGYLNNDLVHFKIGVYDYENGWNIIQFRAFLNNISDSYDATWNAQKYIGRGENFYTYGSFDRKMSLSWTVVAQSKREMIPMYQRLNTLASACAPSYVGSRSGYMQGNISQLIIGDYINSYGLITKVGYEISEDSSWNIEIKTEAQNIGDTVGEMPMMIKVTGFEFIPINEKVPQFKTRFFYRESSNPGAPSRIISNPNSNGTTSNGAISNGITPNTDPVGIKPDKFTMTTIDTPDVDLTFDPINNTANATNNKPQYSDPNAVTEQFSLPDPTSNQNLINVPNTYSNPFDSQNVASSNIPSSTGVTTQIIPTTALTNNNPTNISNNSGIYATYLLDPAEAFKPTTNGDYLALYEVDPDNFKTLTDEEGNEVDNPLAIAYGKQIQNDEEENQMVLNPVWEEYTNKYGVPDDGEEPLLINGTEAIPKFVPRSELEGGEIINKNLYYYLPPNTKLEDFYVK